MKRESMGLMSDGHTNTVRNQGRGLWTRQLWASIELMTGWG